MFGLPPIVRDFCSRWKRQQQWMHCWRDGWAVVEEECVPCRWMEEEEVE